MNISEIVTLFFIMAALALVPSSSVVLVVTRSVTLGFANGVAVTIGIVLGDLVFIVFALYGLTMVAEQFESIFVFIKYIGAAYLIYLGFSLIKSSGLSLALDKNVTAKGDLFTSLLAGFFLTLADVKAIFFYVSLLPVFINISQVKPTDSFALIAVMLFSVGGVKLSYALFSSKVSALLIGNKYGSLVSKITGFIVFIVGVWLLMGELVFKP